MRESAKMVFQGITARNRHMARILHGLEVREVYSSLQIENFERQRIRFALCL